MRIRKLTESEVEFKVEITPSDVPVRGNALVSGDDDLDKEAEDEIIAALDAGDFTMWCDVVVTATWGEISEFVSVGACSYLTESDLMQELIPELRDEALHELNWRVRAVSNSIAQLAV